MGYVRSQFCESWSLVGYLCWVAETKTRSIHQGPLRHTLVTAAERQPCDAVFVHRACLQGQMSIMTFALGLSVLKEQIFLSEGMLQAMTPTLGWMTEQIQTEGLNANTCSKCLVQTFTWVQNYQWRTLGVHIWWTGIREWHEQTYEVQFRHGAQDCSAVYRVQALYEVCVYLCKVWVIQK